MIGRMDGTANSSRCVRGLALPPLLVQLMVSGRWRNPGSTAVREALPWFEDPLEFLPTAARMEQESRTLDMWADDERTSRIFHVTHGTLSGPLRLPWLDADRAVLIAVNRHRGDDVAIALDYRRDPSVAAVVASDAWTFPTGYLWRPAAASFDAFAARLGLTA
jgi:hypothetical protein